MGAPPWRVVVAARGPAILGPLGWCFGAALVTPRVVRVPRRGALLLPAVPVDRREWAAGRVPLWNPQENCGVPVLADTTSSVFYPGKLLFALPLPYAAAYKLVRGRPRAAGGGSGVLCWPGAGGRRGWRPRLAAVSYAFGGSVLFQYCNVVFLVGAAWLPVALLAADRMLVRRSYGWSVASGRCWR